MTVQFDTVLANEVRYKAYHRADSRTGKVDERPFETSHFFKLGIALADERGMLESDALKLMNEWNKMAAGSHFTFWVE